MNSVTIGFAVALLLLLGGLALITLRYPLLAKLGARNIPRRPAQSLFIMLGLTLSTTIFITALSLGDTLNHSIRRQAVDAYGLIDQVISPAFLSSLLALADDGEVDPASFEEDADIVELLAGLAAGDLDSILALIGDGLPGIPEARYLRLKEETAQEPLIDGTAGAIFFPSVIRNLSSGQGEPFGVIFAVDDTYETEFGLHSVEGHPVAIGDLQPGIGTLFAASTVAVNETQIALGDMLATLGLDNGAGGSTAVLGIAAALAMLSGFEGTDFTLNDLGVDLAVLRELGLDTAFLERQGLDILSLEALGLDAEQLLPLGIDPDMPITVPSLQELGMEIPVDANLFARFNLSTLSRDIDGMLEPYGLQVRQGEVYLNELGAMQLDAQPGDFLEIFIGPIPVPYQVRAIVRESGPLGPLMPVAMMDMAEAQKLLFMSERVNAILVSNAGDTWSGIDHTGEVNRILRARSFDETQLGVVKTILRRPSVAEVIHREAPHATSSFEVDVDEGPPILIELLSEIAAGFMGTENFQEHISLLDAFVSEPAETGGEDALADEREAGFREALGNMAVRAWLLDLPLADSDYRALADAFLDLEDFQVLTPLSKQLALQGADIAGVAFGSIFSISGTFSIMAGALLIFLIFVMLAAERRRELGIARAIGMHRGHLVQMFVTEGLLYDVAAALIGLGLGLLVSYSILGFIGNLVAGVSREVGGREILFGVQWSVAPSSLVIAYCLGVLVTGTVVIFASWRVSRTNIVAAIRELPETMRTRPTRRLWRWIRPLIGLPLLGMGSISFWYYILGNSLGALLLDESLMLAGWLYLVHTGLSHTPVSTVIRRRVTYTLLGLGLLMLWVVPWQLDVSGNCNLMCRLGLEGKSVVQDPGHTLSVFIFAGPIVLAGATLAIMGCADILARGFGRLGAGIGMIAPAIHLAVAYPLNHRFRTGMAMLLFALVITTMVVMTQIIRATETIAEPRLEETAGFDILLTPGLLSFFDPVSDLAAEVEGRADFPAADIAVMGSVSTMGVEARQMLPRPGFTYEYLFLSGIDAGYATQAAQVYPLLQRTADYPTDADVWQALATRDDVAVVADWLGTSVTEEMDTGGSEHGPGVEIEMGIDEYYLNFHPFTLEGIAPAPAPLPEVTMSLRHGSGDTQQTVTVQVIGVFSTEKGTLAEGSVQVNRQVLDTLNGQPVIPERHYAVVAEGADKQATARAMERALLSNALNVTLFTEQFVAGQTIIKGILQLFRGFFALGLVVGLAGLAVISIRSVMERRQQVGMLRAIGYQPWSVALIFVLEASFISLSGILMGGATGLILGDRMIGQFYTMATAQSLPVPWLPVTGILLGTYVLALLATVLPAWQAARIYPAEALRYE